MANLFLSTNSMTMSLKASLDTQLRISYNPHYPPKPNKNLNRRPFSPSPKPSPVVALSTRPGADLLKPPKPGVMIKSDETYLGYDMWVPKSPKTEKPKSVHSATSLAYIGDCIYELYARRHFLFPPLSIEEYNDRVMAVVRCEAQDALLKKLVNDNYLSKEERNILRWGKNTVSGKTRTKKRAGVAVYNRASSLETLIGHLYLTNSKRLEEVMSKLGFSTDSSAQLFSEENNEDNVTTHDEAEENDEDQEIVP